MPTKVDAVLQDWFVCFRHSNDGFYLAPELNYKVLAGDVYGHPRHPNGHPVKTSAIVKVEGRVVTTRSGTVYRLGRIQKQYRDWLRKEGITYNHHQPVTIKEFGHKKNEEHGS